MLKLAALELESWESVVPPPESFLCQLREVVSQQYSESTEAENASSQLHEDHRDPLCHSSCLERGEGGDGCL